MIAQMIVEEGPAKGLVFSFREQEEWVIGRDPSLVDWVIEDPSISRRHLLCRRTPEGITIENLSESQPALLNDHPLESSPILHHDDQVRTGDTLFSFVEKEEEIELDLESFEEEHREEELPYETLYEAGLEPHPSTQIDLTVQGRWLLKVVSGPNTGAELSLELGRSYLIGTDSSSCNIVFHDLSISRQHARLTVSDEETLSIEDLHSRNGILVNGQPASEPTPLKGNALVALGTTSFLILDREMPQETMITPPPPPEEVEPEPIEEAIEPETPVLVEKEADRPILSGGVFVLLIFATSVLLVVAFSTMTLFRGKEVPVVVEDVSAPIKKALEPFSEVTYRYTPDTGNLFLLGHVLTPVEKSELLYNIKGLKFVRSVEDNVVVDQYIWEETNAIIADNSEWAGVSLHSPEPGLFVLSGYLKTTSQEESLEDYLHLHFGYLDRLENQIVVEETLLSEIQSELVSRGLTGIQPGLINGELIITGMIDRDQKKNLAHIITHFRQLKGIRLIKDFAVVVQQDEAVIDLSGKYQVQGFSKHDATVVNVLINGQILTRGDTFDGMVITELTPHLVLLEKKGIKYKIAFNPQ